MTELTERSERTKIIAYAVSLGWSFAQESTSTTFDYTSYRITVWWSDNHVATRAEIRTVDGDLLATREWFGDHGTVGEWVRDALRAWQFKWASGASEPADRDHDAEDRGHDRFVDERAELWP